MKTCDNLSYAKLLLISSGTSFITAVSWLGAALEPSPRLDSIFLSLGKLKYICVGWNICHWYFPLRMYILRSAWSSMCLSVNISPCYRSGKEVNSAEFAGAPLVSQVLPSGKSILSSSWVCLIQDNYIDLFTKFSENSLVLTKILRSRLLYSTHL